MGSTPHVRCFHFIIKHIVSSTYIFPQSYYTRNQILTVLMYIVQVFVVITEDSTTNESHRDKIFPPILNVDGRISFAFSMLSFKFVQYWLGIHFSISSLVILNSIHSQTNVSSWLAKSNTHILRFTCLHDHHQMTLNMDMVIPDTCLNL